MSNEKEAEAQKKQARAMLVVAEEYLQKHSKLMLKFAEEYIQKHGKLPECFNEEETDATNETDQTGGDHDSSCACACCESGCGGDVKKVQDFTTLQAHRCWGGGLPYLISTETGSWPYVYSVGMPKLLACPELAIVMPGQQGATIVNQVFDALKDGTLKVSDLKDGYTLPKDKTGFLVDLVLREIETFDHLVQSVHSNVARAELATLVGFGKAFQIMWPDEHGSFDHDKVYHL